jgi:hypothetical protein
MRVTASAAYFLEEEIASRISGYSASSRRARALSAAKLAPPPSR